MTISLNSFDFSPLSDVVEENDVIFIPGDISVATLAGDDSISSIYTTDTFTASEPLLDGTTIELVLGIDNRGSVDTSSGSDIILGDVEYTGESLVDGVYGITQAPNGAIDGFFSATISTGSGNDKVLGLASSSNSFFETAGIYNIDSSEINTGAGADEVRGEAKGTVTEFLTGILQFRDPELSTTNNLIVTGDDDDKVIGVADGQAAFIDGIAQEFGSTELITGNGNDEVIGKASGDGLALDGIIQFGDDELSGNHQIFTGNGNDIVVGEAQGNSSGTLIGISQIFANNQIITDTGADKVIGLADGNVEVISEELEPLIEGTGVIPGIAGISQIGNQEIITGTDDDEVIGKASGTGTSDDGSFLIPIVGIFKSNSTIDTGSGADKVVGEASGSADQIAGIVQQGTEGLIITGTGNDEVVGIATGTTKDPDLGAMAGIAQQPDTGGSQIITDEGDDKVIGTAFNDGEGLTAGILGDLEIVTGLGNDEVIASAQLSGTRVDGFAADPITGEAITVDTGSGNDLVKGFGQGNFDGGEGDRDIYDLSEYHQSEFAIEIGAGGNNEVDFTHSDIFGESTASTQGFEVFLFADGELSFSDLA